MSVMKSSTYRSSREDTPEYKEYRIKILADIIERAKDKKQVIDENYLLYEMKMAGVQNYTRSKLYKDRLVLDTKNNYISNFLPRYSSFQEDLNNELDAIKNEATELGDQDWTIIKKITRETKDGTFETEITEESNFRPKAEFLKIRSKVAELKQKHAEGHNVQISAVIISKELANKKQEIEELKKQNNVIKVTPKDEKKIE